MRVYLDDERATPEGWTRVYWPDEAIALLETGNVAEISLDHDLGDDARGTGYDVVAWIEEAVVTRGFVPPIVRVHSANPAARVRMEGGIAAITRLASDCRGPQSPPRPDCSAMRSRAGNRSPVD
ncbi:MAG: hypothetical protein KF800_08080 [Lysobacter sp.]|nr:hypothetical protein [Lysobacter sp.]